MRSLLFIEMIIASITSSAPTSNRPPLTAAVTATSIPSSISALILSPPSPPGPVPLATLPSCTPPPESPPESPPPDLLSSLDSSPSSGVGSGRGRGVGRTIHVKEVH